MEEVGATSGAGCVQGVAFPETCGIATSTPPCTGWVPGDPTYSPWEPDEESVYYAHIDGSDLRDANVRKRFTRHLGGVNVGFADGHATWINSEALLKKVADQDWTESPGGAYPNSQCGFAESYPGEPTLY